MRRSAQIKRRINAIYKFTHNNYAARIRKRRAAASDAAERSPARAWTTRTGTTRTGTTRAATARVGAAKTRATGAATARAALGRIRKQRLRIDPRQAYTILFRVAVGFVLFILVLGISRLFDNKIKIQASVETVAAFRAPYRSIGLLRAYSAKNGVPFADVFTVFCAENAFFPEKNLTYDLSVLEKVYLDDFDKIKRRYSVKSIKPYIDMYETLFSEIEYFPIPDEFNDETPSVMYGDSWGITRNFEGDKTHKGTDIFDRENIRGRIPVVSMTAGTVQTAGWDNRLGYYTVIITDAGTCYLYAHLDSIEAMISTGQPVTAGQTIGRMGDSGSVKGVSQVHLHIGISPKVGFTKSEFWINPYPLLRYIDEGTVL